MDLSLFEGARFRRLGSPARLHALWTTVAGPSRRYDAGHGLTEVASTLHTQVVLRSSTSWCSGLHHRPVLVDRTVLPVSAGTAIAVGLSCRALASLAEQWEGHVQ
jgi:hypothetical protein